jgi:hypothetical protein
MLHHEKSEGRVGACVLWPIGSAAGGLHSVKQVRAAGKGQFGIPATAAAAVRTRASKGRREGGNIVQQTFRRHASFYF